MTWGGAEPVTVQRTGAAISGLFDPLERRLYLPGGDVVRGDGVSLRGEVRRVSDVQSWLGAGLVAVLDEQAVFLPDHADLLRGSGPGVLDEDTGVISPANTATVWSGLCLVEPAQSDGSNPEIGDQQVGVVPFVVTVPLALTDVRPGDLFKVTQSRDARLLSRTLVVKAVRASSSELTREVLAFDNQGG